MFVTRSQLANVVNRKAFKACGCEISFVNHHRYLGLILDSTMSLGPLTKDIKKRITNKIFM